MTASAFEASTNSTQTTKDRKITPDGSPKSEGAFGTFGALNLNITGLGVEYPPFKLGPDAVETIARKHYPDTPAMKKVLAINNYTGIEYRSAIGPVDHPLVNAPNAPSITQLCEFFRIEAVPYAVKAARKALAEAKASVSEITHVVSTTCTNSANPGYDHFVCQQLGVSQSVEKVLLHGIGCSGGLAGLRTAANLALGASFRGRPARILVVALEISSMLLRSELDSIHELQETRIGVTLFSDCASALVLSNAIGVGDVEEPVYELLGWNHSIIPNTEKDLGFDTDSLGWKVILSPRVPHLAASVVKPTFDNLMASIPDMGAKYRFAEDFDWAVHPGGSTILSGAEKAMGITAEHMRASYDTYINHGNSSSATIFSVMDRHRSKDMDSICPSTGVKDFVVGCAFGPGISIEMCMLKRNLNHTHRVSLGDITPPESDGSQDGGNDLEGVDSLEAALDGVGLD